jgi:leader peptidase (prepilin peptidase)/N-methyltransferase
MSVFVFVLGLMLGSFYNVCIYRIPKEQSIVTPRSACGKCHTTLEALDLIPVISYLVFRGKCRHCHEKYSSRYMFVELLTGALFLFSYLNHGYSLLTLIGWGLSSILVIVVFIDIDHHLIFDRFSVFTILLAFAYHIYVSDVSLLNIGLGFIIGGGFLFLIAILGAMGGGDIKIMASFGFLLGFPKVLLALYLSFIIGGLISLLYIIICKIKSQKVNREIPFGPYLCIGTWLTFYYGNHIVLWYQKLIF